jgi:hypothetical protein
MALENMETGLKVKRIRRKITEVEVKEIARRVAERCLTETEACHLVDIKPVNWFQWKQKESNSLRFNTLFTRMKSAKIESALKRIDDCGDGIGLKQPDWRAKAFMLQAMDRKRFGMQASEPGEQVANYNITVITDSIRRAYADAGGALIQNTVSSGPLIELKPQTPSVGGVKVPRRKG